MKRLQELQEASGDIERLWTERRIEHEERSQGTLLPLKTDRDVDRLNATLEELNASLEKATRRINRLLGEKTQLAALLDKRDDQIQNLNRELGACLPVEKSVIGSNGLASMLRNSPRAVWSITKSFRTYFFNRPETARDAVVVQREGHADTEKRAPLIVRHKDGSARQAVAILLLGLSKDEIERLLPLVERDCSSRAMAPVCIVDIDTFELFRRRGLTFEYLPPADDRKRFDPSLHWDLYMQRRLALIRRKWDPVRVISFGETATRILTLWSSSPFEGKPLPTAIRETPASP